MLSCNISIMSEMKRLYHTCIVCPSHQAVSQLVDNLYVSDNFVLSYWCCVKQTDVAYGGWQVSDDFKILNALHKIKTQQHQHLGKSWNTTEVKSDQLQLISDG